MKTKQTMPLRRGLMGVYATAPEADVHKLIKELNSAFNEFKIENNKREENIKKGVIDALQETTIKNLESRITELQAAVDQANQAMVGMRLVGDGEGKVDAEYSAAFNANLRSGEINAALNKGAAEDGGYLVPTEWDRTLEKRLLILSPMRSLAKVQTTSKPSFTRLFTEHGMSSGWVGETDARPETTTGKFKPFTYNTGEIYVNPSATQQMLDDSEINLESWLLGEIDNEIALQEGKAFLTGDGVNKPTGLLTYIEGNANASKHPYGAIKVVKSGNANEITADALIDLVYALPATYASNAGFVMNRNTLATLRKLKDGQGNYLWQPSLVAGQPSTLLGYKVTELVDMPDVAANTTPVLFGDLAQGYMVLDRVGVRVLRDPYTNKPFVSFYTTKRVGGGLLNPDTMKVLKVAT
ncbi:phage major capsid protein [Pelistega ratti]|uniref:phage major capsid protein n=1 Tax=Pelistega ratti TaxID=2652177 RepID=UPI001357FDCA|nr:phage major capsid protein [Pelistega ratti]